MRELAVKRLTDPFIRHLALSGDDSGHVPSGGRRSLTLLPRHPEQHRRDDDSENSNQCDVHDQEVFIRLRWLNQLTLADFDYVSQRESENESWPSAVERR
jgi:hypothetical protein